MQGSIHERIRKKMKNAQGRIRTNVKVYDVKYRYKNIVTGKIVQTVKRGFVRKGDAEKFLLDLNNKIETNIFVPPKIILFKDYLADWLSDYAEINLRRNTYLGYKRIVDNHFIPALGNLEMKDITATHIDKMYAYLLRDGRSNGKGGLSPKSVLYSHRVLNEAFEHAVKKQLIYYNPVRGVTNTPKPKKFRGNIYNAEEILELLILVKDTQFEIPVALAAICGLRRGECLALTIDDVDFENRRIRINKQLNDVENKIVIGDPKSEESNRIVSAPKEIFDIITRCIQRHEVNKQLLSSEYKDYRLLACHDDGSPIRPVYFSKNFSRLITKYKLKKIRFHDLRHSCASLMLKSGVAMKTASNILGHSSIGITADLYTHVLDDTKQEAALQIGKELFGHKDDNDNDK